MKRTNIKLPDEVDAKRSRPIPAHPRVDALADWLRIAERVTEIAPSDRRRSTLVRLAHAHAFGLLP